MKDNLDQVINAWSVFKTPEHNRVKKMKQYLWSATYFDEACPSYQIFLPRKTWGIYLYNAAKSSVKYRLQCKDRDLILSYYGRLSKELPPKAWIRGIFVFKAVSIHKVYNKYEVSSKSGSIKITLFLWQNIKSCVAFHRELIWWYQ